MPEPSPPPTLSSEPLTDSGLLLIANFSQPPLPSESFADIGLLLTANLNRTPLPSQPLADTGLLLIANFSQSPLSSQPLTDTGIFITTTAPSNFVRSRVAKIGANFLRKEKILTKAMVITQQGVTGIQNIPYLEPDFTGLLIELSFNPQQNVYTDAETGLIYIKANGLSTIGSAW